MLVIALALYIVFYMGKIFASNDHSIDTRPFGNHLTHWQIVRSFNAFFPITFLNIGMNFLIRASQLCQEFKGQHCVPFVQMLFYPYQRYFSKAYKTICCKTIYAVRMRLTLTKINWKIFLHSCTKSYTVLVAFKNIHVFYEHKMTFVLQSLCSCSLTIINKPHMHTYVIFKYMYTI